MLRRSIVCLVSLGVLIAGSAESVEDEVDYTREGPYLGFDGLVAIDTSNSVLDVDTTGGLAARIGFRMRPEIAVEIAGEWAYLDGRNPWSLLTVIKLYPFLVILHIISFHHLPWSGDARLHGDITTCTLFSVALVVVFKLFTHDGPSPDHTHLTPENVDKLREFIKTGPP